MAELALGGKNSGRAETYLARWLDMMEGRGACKHPDGVTRFVSSGLRVYSDEIVRHRRHGPCPEGRTRILPTPDTGGSR
jgi:hypothetical protein